MNFTINSIVQVLVILFLFPSFLFAQDDSYCVENVEGQFAGLDRYGEPMGLHMGLFSGDTHCISDCSCLSHYQSIVRKPGPGTPFLYISKNNDPEIIVARMGSRDTDGERLRSNRLVPGFSTRDSIPPFIDGEVATADFQYFQFLDATFGFDHIGGMQTIGNTLVASLEGDGAPPFFYYGAVVLMDTSNPHYPVSYYTLLLPHKNGSTAMARLDDGRYVLLIGAEGSGNKVYVSNGADLRSPFLSFFYVGDLGQSPTDPNFGYNHVNFIKQCDGTLYAIGMERFHDSCTGPLSQAQLWKIHVSSSLFSRAAGPSPSSNGPSVMPRTSIVRGVTTSTPLGLGNNPPPALFAEFVHPIGHIELNCFNSFEEDVSCDFKAAAGTYVSPSGKLILYGSVHQRGDPFTAFAEFRAGRLKHPHVQPWVQMYSDQGGWNKRFPFGRSTIFDMPDRYKDDYNNFFLLDAFDNTVQSVRWWAPEGCDIELIENPCITGHTGNVLTLEGTGKVEKIRNLSNTSFGNNIASAVRFCFDSDQPYNCNQLVNPPSPACQDCRADLNNDCYVDDEDLAILNGYLGTSNEEADLNNDGIVDQEDVAILNSLMGPCYEEGPDLVIGDININNINNCAEYGHTIDGTVELKNIGLNPAFGSVNLGFSLSIDDNPHNSGDDISMGGLSLNLNPPLLPGSSRIYTFNSLSVPNIATLTTQNFFICADPNIPGQGCGNICEGCEINNCSSATVNIGLGDLVVNDIDYPSTLITGELAPITTTVSNLGCFSQCVPTTSCIGQGPGSNCWTRPICVNSMQESEITLDVLTPLSPLNCGAPDTFSISSCINSFDANIGNNCLNQSVQVIEEFWDLDLDITSGDDSIGLGETMSYNVRVTNRGNIPSPSCISFITGIDCVPGPGNWNCMLVGDTYTQIGSVQPGTGNSKTFSFEFTIPTCCNIIIGDQWLKAEILYTLGENCDDDCGEFFGNNFHQEVIDVTF